MEVFDEFCPWNDLHSRKLLMLSYCLTLFLIGMVDLQHLAFINIMELINGFFQNFAFLWQMFCRNSMIVKNNTCSLSVCVTVTKRTEASECHRPAKSISVPQRSQSLASIRLCRAWSVGTYMHKTQTQLCFDQRGRIILINVVLVWTFPTANSSVIAFEKWFLFVILPYVWVKYGQIQPLV